MSSDGGSWAPFGPADDGDDEDERRDDPPEFDPPAPPPTTPLAWPDPEPQPQAQPQPPPPSVADPEPPPIHNWAGPPPTPYGQPAVRTSGNATASLVLGIVGLVLCPLVVSIPAVVLGNAAKKEIRANPGMQGDGMATWGIALGWIGAVWGAFVLLVILFGAVS